MRLNLGAEVARCHNQCRHCYARQGRPPGDRMAFADIERVIAATDDLGWDTDCGFLSGPLAHSRWADILALQHKRLGPLQVPIDGAAPNGAELTPGDAQQMRSRGVWGVQLTLYGLERTHDAFACARGAFRRDVGAARTVTAAGMWVWRIQIMLHRGNVAQMPALIDLARSIQDMNPSGDCPVMPSIALVPPSFSGRWADNPALVVTESDLDRLSDEARALLVDKDLRTEQAWIEETRQGRVSPAAWAARKADVGSALGLLVDSQGRAWRRRDSREPVGSLWRDGLRACVDRCLAEPDRDLATFAALGDEEILGRFAGRGKSRAYAFSDVARKWFAGSMPPASRGRRPAR